MALVPVLTDEQAGPEASAVFDDIRASRNTDYINNIWRALANDPKQLKLTWEQVKTVMSQGALDPLTKGLIYIAYRLPTAAAIACTRTPHRRAPKA